jgi:ring-1,2-phenylacetyl-CoA epoxidase subunit PaaD
MPAMRDAGGRRADSPVPVDPRDVLAALDGIADPEIPAVSIVELGMIGGIDVEPRRLRVQLLPTFVGCPALEIIRDAISSELGRFGLAVQVDVSFATPWTSDRISAAGREKLRRSGFAPPPHLSGEPASLRGAPGGEHGARRPLPMVDPRTASPASAVPCPYCGSTNTTLENVFGPTQCRSIRHCADCRQPFEAFKPI